jgi:hypothetical protein
MRHRRRDKDLTVARWFDTYDRYVPFTTITNGIITVRQALDMPGGLDALLRPAPAPFPPEPPTFYLAPAVAVVGGERPAPVPDRW